MPYNFWRSLASSITFFASATPLDTAFSLLNAPFVAFATMLANVARAEDEIDNITDDYRNAQMDRMRTTTCSPEASVVYAEMLTDFERIGDHLLTIAEDFAKMYPAKN